MGHFLVKLENRYFEWSTIVDCPVSAPMTLEELKAHVQEEHGANGMRELGPRIERLEENGFSLHDRSYDIGALICCNRCGPGESEWTEEQLRAWARGEI